MLHASSWLLNEAKSFFSCWSHCQEKVTKYDAAIALCYGVAQQQWLGLQQQLQLDWKHLLIPPAGSWLAEAAEVLVRLALLGQ